MIKGAGILTTIKRHRQRNLYLAQTSFAVFKHPTAGQIEAFENAQSYARARFNMISHSS